MISASSLTKKIATNIFVTVGTTEFDELIEALDCELFAEAISSLSCKNLVVQIGRGYYEPQILANECSRRGISTSFYRFKPTLDEDMKSASLIISHCGAGSILESISSRKDLIVVVNCSLQGNHQTELATALAAEDYCVSTKPAELINLLRSSKISSEGALKCFPEADPTLFPRVIDNLFGWLEDDL